VDIQERRGCMLHERSFICPAFTASLRTSKFVSTALNAGGFGAKTA